MPIIVRVERARGLPWTRWLCAPNPYVEVHFAPGGVATATSQPAVCEDEPEWPGFHVVLDVRPSVSSPGLVGIVVRDAAHRDAVLGRACIRVAASVTEGWFPLETDDSGSRAHRRTVEHEDGGRLQQRWSSEFNAATSTRVSGRKMFYSSSAEVFVRIEWPEYCSLPEYVRGTAESTQNISSDEIEAEMRSVSDKPGRFFRSGELFVAVCALGVPNSVRNPKLVLDIPDQRLRGFEVPHSFLGSTAVGESGEQGNLRQTIGPVASKSSLSEPSNSYKARHDVSFGTFSFVLFQGVFPEFLRLSIVEQGKTLPHSKVLEKITVHLPENVTGCSAGSLPHEAKLAGQMALTSISNGDGSSSSYSSRDASSFVQHMLVSAPGASESKVIFDVRLHYVLRKPAATCYVVTPRFYSIMAELKSDTSVIKTRYPKACNLTYLLVGGLFTDHYPLYFVDNIRFLKNELGISDIHSVKIHTEATVNTNAEVIKQAVLEYAQDRLRGIVLVGHSKGGVDICSAIAKYPDMDKYIFGVISFQSPFCGTFLVDFLKSKALAQKALVGTIQNLWGGEGDAVLDIGYEARFKDILSHRRLNRHSSKGPSDVQDNQVPIEAVDEDYIASCLEVYKSVPTISFASCASFSVRSLRTVANAAGFASMAPLARLITERTGFCCDGLVSPCDARVPYSDLVYLQDMMHSEPALFFKGTKYPPGMLTAAAIALLFEKAARECRLQEESITAESGHH